MNILTMLLPAIIPALTDSVRGVVAKFTGGAGAQPQNVAEAVTLMEAQTRRLEAMAALDKPAGEVSRWVSDARAIFRYAAILLIFIFTAAAVAGSAPAWVVVVLLDMCGASMSFIIGERMYLKFKGAV